MTRVEVNPGKSNIRPVISVESIGELQNAAGAVYCAETVKQYIAKLSAATRKQPDFKLGVSPRASIHLMQTSKSLALLEGRDYVTPQDVRQMCVPVLSHRLSIRSESIASGKTVESVLTDMLQTIAVPK